MASANPSEQMGVPDSQDSDINILLLGETGVGKSTFINSFVNFLQHTTLSNAMNSELACLIPLKFTIPDEDFEEKVIEFGSDINEDTEIGNSSTQGARGYLFPFENYNIRLIDTPGIGDARGIKQDGENFENVLSYISQYKNLHGICFLLKPNVSVINAYFKFCIVHLISRLEKSAVNNIIFIFTNSRNTFYRPGETLHLLKRILNEIRESPPHVEVQCSKKNMFCVDNEAFKFLIAKKHGIKFDDTETKEFEKSWKTSYKTCKDILSYICGDRNNEALTPHDIKNTISVNEARRAIIDLSKPLADISDFILDNVTNLERQVTLLQQANLSKKDLINNLHIPTIQLRITKSVEPMTVCVSPKCAEEYNCGGITKYRYKQICHRPCHLTYIPNSIIGASELLDCAAFSKTTCNACKCNYSVHMHVHYETEIVQNKQENVSVKKKIKNKQDEIKAKNNLVAKLKKTIADFVQERDDILKCMAKFAHFLKENSISAYNDHYLDYLNHLIDREKSLGKQKNEARVKHYTSLKSSYEQEKNKLVASANNENVEVSEIPVLIQLLYKLPLTGSKISMLHSYQQRSIQNSIQSQEYRYPELMKSFVSESSSSDEDEVVSSTKFIPVLMPKKELKQKELNLGDKQPSYDRDEKLSTTKLKPTSMPDNELKLLDEQPSYDRDEFPGTKLMPASISDKELKLADTQSSYDTNLMPALISDKKLKLVDKQSSHHKDEKIPTTKLISATISEKTFKLADKQPSYDKDEKIPTTKSMPALISDKKLKHVDKQSSYHKDEKIPTTKLMSASISENKFKPADKQPSIHKYEKIPTTNLMPALISDKKLKLVDKQSSHHKDENIPTTKLISATISEETFKVVDKQSFYHKDEKIPTTKLMSASMSENKFKLADKQSLYDKDEKIPTIKLLPASISDKKFNCTDEPSSYNEDKESQQKELECIDEQSPSSFLGTVANYLKGFVIKTEKTPKEKTLTPTGAVKKDGCVDVSRDMTLDDRESETFTKAGEKYGHGKVKNNIQSKQDKYKWKKL